MLKNLSFWARVRQKNQGIIFCPTLFFDILPTLLCETARDSLTSLLGAFCLIAPAVEAEPLSGLTVAPQTDTASPAAFEFL